MATVPSAAKLGLSTNVKTSPDRTPIDGPNVQLAAAAPKIAAKQTGDLSGQLLKTSLRLSDAVTEAQNKIQNREDNINRRREFNNYFQEMSGEFQKFGDGDLADSASFEAFEATLTKKTNKYLQDHAGSPDSKNKFLMRIEEQRFKFSTQAKDLIDTAQQALVDKDFGDDLSGIIADVARGKVNLAQALVKVDVISKEYAEVAGDAATFDKTEAAQELVILGVIQRFADLGQTEKAEGLINGNPEVLQTLDPKQVGKLIRQIELQKIEKAKLVAEKRFNQEGILKAAGVDDPRNLSPELRVLYFTGKMGTSAKDERTTEQKNAEALTRIEMKHGKDNPAWRNLNRIIDGKNRLPKTELTIKLERLEVLNKTPEGKASPEAKILQDEINQKDPLFIAKKQLEKDFPVAQESMINLESETAMLLGKIDEALILATNTNNIDEAIKAAKRGEGGFWETGNVGLISSFVSGSTEAAELEAALMPIRSNTILNVMEEMRAQSSSGATGLGAMSEPERIMLRDAEGALDPRVPGQLLSTLLRMRKDLPATLKRQKDTFTKSFAPILGGKVEEPDPKATVKPEERGDGKPAESTTGSPVIRLDKYESGGSGEVKIEGGSGDDTLAGEAILEGGAGDDTLSAEARGPELRSADPTWRESGRAFSQDTLMSLGMDKNQSRDISENIFGNEATGKIGLVDFLGIGEVMGIQEGFRQYERGANVGSTEDKAMGTLMMGLNAAPLAGAAGVGAAKLIKKGLQTGKIRQAERMVLSSEMVDPTKNKNLKAYVRIDGKDYIAKTHGDAAKKAIDKGVDIDNANVQIYDGFIDSKTKKKYTNNEAAKEFGGKSINKSRRNFLKNVAGTSAAVAIGSKFPSNQVAKGVAKTVKEVPVAKKVTSKVRIKLLEKLDLVRSDIWNRIFADAEPMNIIEAAGPRFEKRYDEVIEESGDFLEEESQAELYEILDEAFEDLSGDKVIETPKDLISLYEEVGIPLPDDLKKNFDDIYSKLKKAES